MRPLHILYFLTFRESPRDSNESVGCSTHTFQDGCDDATVATSPNRLHNRMWAIYMENLVFCKFLYIFPTRKLSRESFKEFKKSGESFFLWDISIVGESEIMAHFIKPFSECENLFEGQFFLSVHLDDTIHFHS